MTSSRSLLFPTVVLLALSACADAPERAQTSAAMASPKPMACMAGKDMQCGMMSEMGAMKDRMAKMHEMMEACAKTDKPCAMDQMMPDMQAMHDKMKAMMGEMKGMAGKGGMMGGGAMMQGGMQAQPKAAAPPAKQDEDHSQHHPDQTKPQ
ncbi:MAG: hypothetical protein SFV19_12380 [Rhodospirillaceae bacterium]|nr:hypothetical protein [Rhodospirillaceae bacterium]